MKQYEWCVFAFPKTQTSMLRRPSVSLPTVLSGVLSVIGTTYRVLNRQALRFCNARLPSLFIHKPLLKDVSATGMFSRACDAMTPDGENGTANRHSPRAGFLPALAIPPHHAAFTAEHSSGLGGAIYQASPWHTSPRLTVCSFYNYIWLVLNDIIVGSAVGSFLRENSEYLSWKLLLYTQVQPLILAPRTSF